MKLAEYRRISLWCLKVRFGSGNALICVQLSENTGPTCSVAACFIIRVGLLNVLVMKIATRPDASSMVGQGANATGTIIKLR